ncbi:MAG: ABC transporter substrate-binding protein [Victivallaceae bacterium]
MKHFPELLTGLKKASSDNVSAIRRKALLLIAVFAAALVLAGCGKGVGPNPPNTMFLNTGGKVKTLDPALASDLSSRNMVAAFYDTLLQYDYASRPYKLAPSMLETMPESNREMTSFKFRLRDDLYFHDDQCFSGMTKSARKVTSKDVVYSFLRIADSRLLSPVFWMFRGKIKGIDQFRTATSQLSPTDKSIYEQGVSGLEIVDDLTFIIHLNASDPRFLYSLAIPYASIVSRRAVEYYGESFPEHPVGSGPFRLAEWIRDYRLIMDRNQEFRKEFFVQAANPADRNRPLPFLDRIVCYIIKQPLSAWLLFLQGELDQSTLDKDNLDAVVGGGRTLVPALAKRGIQLIQAPEFEIRYVGFNFSDPLLANNLNLRKAISLAYNVETIIEHSNYQMIPAQGPIPQGVSGYDEKFKNPFTALNIEAAKTYLAQAGYPGGIDPATGQQLTLTYDQNGNAAGNRQLAELMVRDMAAIGIKIIPLLNNNPRFFQKMRKGKFQLFRLSWVGDYPDAENFLQLFYGKNAGSCNRVFYRDEKFDRMFEQIMPMPDSPERTRLYEEMVKYITAQCPWIFESFPISFQLNHAWLQNYIPHDFAFARWKYLAIDHELRSKMKKSFTPLSMEELRQ